MFSVVIPLYNKEHQIRRTLESVLSQTFENFEVVIVNDGSTDKSVEVVSEFKDKRIRLINKPNGGVSSARNMGIQEAHFEWIAFLDADDLWKENKLEKVADVVKDNPDVCWMVSGYQTIKGAKIADHSYAHNGFLDDALDALGNKLSIQTSTVVLRKKYFIADEKLYFPLGINNSEDREVWYRLIFRFPRLYYIQEVLSYYIIDETGGSLNNGTVGNFSFLKLKHRLSNDFDLLTSERKQKFLSFIDKFNNTACWRIWSNIGWRSDFNGFVSNIDEKIMKLFSNYPAFIRLVVFKIRR